MEKPTFVPINKRPLAEQLAHMETLPAGPARDSVIQLLPGVAAEINSQLKNTKIQKPK